MKLCREHAKECRVRGTCVWCAFEAHLSSVHASSSSARSCVRPTQMVKALRVVAPHMRPGRQEDAHEYLVKLVDGKKRYAYIRALE